MATLQCSKPAANETCQQKSQENSFGQTVSKMTTRTVQGLHHESQTSCQVQTEKQVTAKAQAGETHIASPTKSQPTNGMAACQGKAKKRGGTEHKKKERKNLLQRIKDGISGDSSSSDSSSGESDNDNDSCGKKKN